MDWEGDEGDWEDREGNWGDWEWTGKGFGGNGRELGGLGRALWETLTPFPPSPKKRKGKRVGNPCPICRDHNLHVDYRVSGGGEGGAQKWGEKGGNPSSSPSSSSSSSSGQNVKLLEQFVCPHSGSIFHPTHTGGGGLWGGGTGVDTKAPLGSPNLPVGPPNPTGTPQWPPEILWGHQTPL